MSAAEFDITAAVEVLPPPYGMGPGSDKGVAARSRLDRVLDGLAIDAHDRDKLLRQARRHGSTLADEIVATRTANARSLSRAVAEVLGLTAEDPSADITIVKDARGLLRCGAAHLVGSTLDHAPRVFVAPDLERLDEIAAALPETDEECDRIRITSPSAIAAAVAVDSCRHRSDAARLSLAADLNRWSAREVLTAFQGAILSMLATGVLVASLLLGSHAWFAAHLFCTLVAFACTIFRLVVLCGSPRAATPAVSLERSLSAAGLPFYSVLVALHHEAEIAPAMVRAMAALDWPASRLEILLVCEATDPETIAAVERAITPYSHFTVVVTPASNPTTKPKALNFALPLARGEFVVLFDAEDRPHPRQLREAWSRFRTADPQLACLQAPLVVTNGATGWRQAHFAMEYVVLFRMLLPWLAARSLPLPLGGTSNHFRREHLVSVGGWDSHNVAEDADLGIRLARLGFTTSVLRYPTYETATTRWQDWRNQRTRWMKGWIQTWLVHMRDPMLTMRQLGLRGLLAFQIVFTGMVASAFAHIVLAAHLAWAAMQWQLGQALLPGHGWLAILDMLNLTLAYLTFGLSFARVSTPGERPLAVHLVSLWGYWFIVSCAAMRALWQLVRAPHLWEKTPHRCEPERYGDELEYEP